MSFDINQFYFDNNKILQTLSGKTRLMVERAIVKKKIKSGKTIYSRGKRPKGVYILRKGKVKIYQTNPDTRKQIMYIYSVGEMFGYRPLISREMHPVTAVALEDCSFDFIPADHFLKCLRQSNELCQVLLESLCHEFTVWTNNISVFARYPVRSRVALGLLVLKEKYKTKDRDNEVSLSRSEFASYVGTVKETVVRVIQDFRKRKIVETHGSKIRILRPEDLKAYVNFY